jgi:phosphoribosylanthranilate isomerase
VSRVHVKVCGVRTPQQAREIVLAGASAIGLNFVPESVRHVTPEVARTIARAVHELADVGRQTLVVGVVANLTVGEMQALCREAELDCLQLHGDESNETVQALLPHAYKAVAVANAADVERARATPGKHVLVDTKVTGALGGTGVTFDWSLVGALARERHLTLAGGLTPANVERAVREVRPFCVDVASGVEREPGVKDLARVRAFIEAVERAQT